MPRTAEQLEGEQRAEIGRGRDHRGPRVAGVADQPLETDLVQERSEEEEEGGAALDLDPRAEAKLTHIGDRRGEQRGSPPLLGGASRQPSDPGLPKEKPDGVEADGTALRPQPLRDVDHAETLFVTETKDGLPERLGDRAVLATVGNVPEERGELTLTELRGHDLEGVGRVVEAVGPPRRPNAPRGSRPEGPRSGAGGGGRARGRTPVGRARRLMYITTIKHSVGLAQPREVAGGSTRTSRRRGLFSTEELGDRGSGQRGLLLCRPELGGLWESKRLTRTTELGTRNPQVFIRCEKAG